MYVIQYKEHCSIDCSMYRVINRQHQMCMLQDDSAVAVIITIIGMEYV